MKSVRFAFGIGPEQEMAHLMIESLDPHAFALVNATAFPVFRMDQMDTAVFVGLTRGFAPIDVFIPFDAWQIDAIVAAKIRDGAAKCPKAMFAKKVGQVPVDFSAESDWGNYHSHGMEGPPIRMEGFYCFMPGYVNFDRRRNEKPRKTLRFKLEACSSFYVDPFRGLL